MTHPENHPYEIFFPEKTQSLIIGTFPCIDFTQRNYGHWFYSTNNKNLLWTILSTVFTSSVIDRQEKEKLLSTNNFGMADIAQVIQRTNQTCADTDFKIIEPNRKLLTLISDNINLVLYFTSKTAQKLTNDFYFENFKSKICNTQINLPSPSKSASRSIARTDDYKRYKNLNATSNTMTYRIEKYSELLKNKL